MNRLPNRIAEICRDKNILIQIRTGGNSQKPGDRVNGHAFPLNGRRRSGDRPIHRFRKPPFDRACNRLIKLVYYLCLHLLCPATAGGHEKAVCRFTAIDDDAGGLCGLVFLIHTEIINVGILRVDACILPHAACGINGENRHHPVVRRTVRFVDQLVIYIEFRSVFIPFKTIDVIFAGWIARNLRLRRPEVFDLIGAVGMDNRPPCLHFLQWSEIGFDDIKLSGLIRIMAIIGGFFVAELRARILVILRADHPPGEMAAIPCGRHFETDFKIAVFGG